MRLVVLASVSHRHRRATRDGIVSAILVVLVLVHTPAMLDAQQTREPILGQAGQVETVAPDPATLISGTQRSAAFVTGLFQGQWHDFGFLPAGSGLRVRFRTGPVACDLIAMLVCANLQVQPTAAAQLIVIDDNSGGQGDPDLQLLPARNTNGCAANVYVVARTEQDLCVYERSVKRLGPIPPLPAPNGSE